MCPILRARSCSPHTGRSGSWRRPPRRGYPGHMGRGQWIVVLALAGCDELAGIGTPGPAQSHCVIGGLDLCLNAEPQNPLSIDADLTLNTNTDCSVVHYVPPQPSLCVIYASDVAINAKLFATGSRPLVIAATNTITITGSVDVSSYRSKSAGAAANDATCMTWSRSGIEYGGGAGGSFIGAGGAGGEGYNRDPGTQPGPTHAVPSHPR